ncbi:Uncharacterised protein [Klebsiella pneumoniae]|nr:Uncharacterised protein [Klebsiella pneumoniae]
MLRIVFTDEGGQHCDDLHRSGQLRGFRQNALARHRRLIESIAEAGQQFDAGLRRKLRINVELLDSGLILNEQSHQDRPSDVLHTITRQHVGGTELVPVVAAVLRVFLPAGGRRKTDAAL